jgi:hypothetical protein
MSLGVVCVGERLKIIAANICNGRVGAVLGAYINIGLYVPVPSPLPCAGSSYLMVFQNPLPTCNWSVMSVFHLKDLSDTQRADFSVMYPNGGHIYLIRANLLVRVSAAAQVVKEEEDSGYSEEIKMILSEQKAEENRQLEAAKKSRDAIFRSMFGPENLDRELE